jgi:hypothetical protein
MASHGFEDWLIGTASAIAVVGTLAAHVLSGPITSTAYAAEPEAQAAYTITVTAKRLPSQCKIDPRSNACALRETTETMRAN